MDIKNFVDIINAKLIIDFLKERYLIDEFGRWKENYSKIYLLK